MPGLEPRTPSRANTLALGAALVMLVTACSSDEARTSTTTYRSTTTTALRTLPTPIVVRGTGQRNDCYAPVLVPGFLPAGFEPIRDPQRKTADWQTAYGNGAARIFVYGDFSGDWGDDPNLQKVTVRGHDAETGLAAGHVEGSPDDFAVTWEETAPCKAPFATFATGVDAATMLRVAQSLRSDDTPQPDLAVQTEEARRMYVGRRYTHTDRKNGTAPPKLQFAAPDSATVWLIEPWTPSDQTGARAVDEVFDGSRRMVLFGEIEGSGTLETVATVVWDVLVIDFNAQYACGVAGHAAADTRSPIFGRLPPNSTGRYLQPAKAWRADTDRRRITEIDAADVKCDLNSETGDYPGPYTDA